MQFDPYEDRGNDAVAKLCQMQIFFSLLGSVALTSVSSEQEAGSNMDVLLVVLYLVPVRPPCNSREARSPLTLGFVIGAGRAGGLRPILPNRMPTVPFRLLLQDGRRV